MLLRRDWEFLFEQLKSTDAVVRYLHRIAPDDAVPLGDEPVRYYEYANADARKAPEPPDPRITVPGTDTLSAPLLPRAPAGAEDRPHHQLIRIMLEDIANSPLGEDHPEARRLGVLAAIDTLPIDYRAALGRQLLAWLRDVTSPSEVEGIKWAFRRVLRPDHPHVAVAAATSFNDAVLEGFRRWVVLRHTQMLQMLGDRPDLRTVAMLLTPRRDGHRPWDTTMVSVQGELDVDDTYLAEAERLWPLTAG